MGVVLAFPSSEKDTYPRRYRYTPPSVQALSQNKEAESEGHYSDSASDIRLTEQETTVPDESIPPHTWNRISLRDYIVNHSPRSTQMPTTRQPFVGELIPLVSPEDSDISFSIKRLNARDVMSYRDKNSQVRYIMEDDNERVITEKDYPMGSMRVDVVVLGLAGWNVTDAAGNPLSITRENILSYLVPDEIDAIYDKVMEVNPILSGEKARKNG